jgi:hypothetical protein
MLNEPCSCLQLKTVYIVRNVRFSVLGGKTYASFSLHKIQLLQHKVELRSHGIGIVIISYFHLFNSGLSFVFRV